MCCPSFDRIPSSPVFSSGRNGVSYNQENFRLIFLESSCPMLQPVSSDIRAGPLFSSSIERVRNACVDESILKVSNNRDAKRCTGFPCTEAKKEKIWQ